MLPQIRHIVVLMMENHSYDNYLGTLGRGDGFTPGPDGRPDAANPRLDGKEVTAHRAAGPGQVPRSPTQSWHASHLQWDGGRCDGFVRSVEITAPKADADAPMAYWTGADLPFYHGARRRRLTTSRAAASCTCPAGCGRACGRSSPATSRNWKPSTPAPAATTAMASGCRP